MLLELHLVELRIGKHGQIDVTVYGTLQKKERLQHLKDNQALPLK